jgi:hypothetical protein
MSRELTAAPTLGTTRDAARFAVVFPRGVARDGCATGAFATLLLIGVTSAKAGKTSSPLNTTISLFMIKSFIPYVTFYHIVHSVTSEKTSINHNL